MVFLEDGGEEGNVVHCRECCAALKRIAWFFKEDGFVTS